MKRYEILDKIDEIVTKNHAQFIGTNEAELFAREEIADFIIDEIVDTVRLFTDLEREEILMIYYSGDVFKNIEKIKKQKSK